MDQLEPVLICCSGSLRAHILVVIVFSFLLLMQWNSKSFVDVVAAITHILLMVLLKIHCINSPNMSS